MEKGRTTARLKSFDGWALRRAIQLEEEFGLRLVSRIVAAPNTARQAAFCALSNLEQGEFERSEIDWPKAMKVADAILHKPSVDVLRTAFGEVPDGFCGLLARVGEAPLDEWAYCDLFEEFRTKSRRSQVLRQISGEISRWSIRSALTLDEVAVFPGILSSARIPESSNLNAVLEVLRRSCSSATDDVLRASLKNFQTEGSISKWATRFLANRLDRLPYEHPVAVDDPDLRPLLAGRHLREEGRRLKNCLGTRCAHVAAGLTAYAVGRNVDAVIELRRLKSTGVSPAWIVSTVLGTQNTTPDPDVLEVVDRALNRYGIPTTAPVPRGEERAFEILRTHDFGLFD